MAVRNSDSLLAADTGGYAMLYVDDEEQALKYFAKAFGGRFNVLTASSVDRALDLLKDHHQRVAVLLTDQRMPGRSGVDLLTHVRQAYPDVLRIIVTAYADLDSALASVNEGAVYKYLTKPLELAQTRRVINEAMATFTASRELDAMSQAEPDQIERLAVADQVRHVAAMTTGLAREVRESTTAINRLFEDLRARGAATTATRVSAKPTAAVETGTYLDQLFQLADLERGRLAALVREVDARLTRSQIQCDGPFKLADLLEQATEQARAVVGDAGVASLDAASGSVTLRADAAAAVRMFRTLAVQVARRSRRGTQVSVTAVDGGVACWGGTSVRVLIRGHVGDAPGGTNADDAAWFMPFPLTAGAPGDWGLELLDAFVTALGHGGDVFEHRGPPSGPGFEVWLPVDPATAHRPRPFTRR